jgi:branched-chain amino acid transport system permease protein
MILSGYTGLASLGHAAFLGIGAYTHAFLLTHGIPFILSIPIVIIVSFLVGAIIGIPILRLSGMYLAIATLALCFIAEHVFIRWEHFTGGNRGLEVPYEEIFGISLTNSAVFYYLCLFFLIISMFAAINILRSPTGRAFVAIRDSEIAAQSLGVNLGIYKALSFAISGAFTGLAGALLAHYIGYLAPDIFNIFLSLTLLLLIVVGGMGSLHGTIFGAIFVGFLPQLIAICRDYLPSSIGSQPGLEPMLFGLILVLFILYEPLGIYGRWIKIKLFFEMFPTYKKQTFKKQKVFNKTDRV